MIVVDVETTGIFARKHSIVSIGAVDFSNPENQFYVECQMDPDAEVMEEALRVNGFSQEQITDSAKPTVKVALEQFIAWAKDIPDHTLAGQNPAFDRDFLRCAMEKWGLPEIIDKHTIDLHALAYTHQLKTNEPIPLKNHRSALTLDNILQLVGIPPEPKPHNGLRGAKLEAEAFSRYIFGKSLLAEYAQYPLPTNFQQSLF